MLEKLHKGSHFYLFLKLVQIKFIFVDNVRKLYIYLETVRIHTRAEELSVYWKDD